MKDKRYFNIRYGKKNQCYRECRLVNSVYSRNGETVYQLFRWGHGRTNKVVKGASVELAVGERIKLVEGVSATRKALKKAKRNYAFKSWLTAWNMAKDYNIKNEEAEVRRASRALEEVEFRLEQHDYAYSNRML